MRWTIGRRIALGFVLPVVALVAIGAVSYRTTLELEAAVRWVSHTHQVISAARGLLESVREVQAGQRGYVISGSEEWLEPYKAGLKDVEARARELRTLTADNPLQQQRLDRVERLISERLTFAKAVIEARRSKGFEAARKLTMTGQGHRGTEEVSRMVDEMERDERALLQQRQGAADASSAQARGVILWGTLLAALVVAVAAALITRGIVGSIRAAANVLASSASETLAATTEQAAGATEEVTAVQETSSTVEELRQTVQMTAEKMRAVAEQVEKTNALSLEGRRSVEQSIQSIQDVKARLGSLAERVLTLAEHGQRIAEITATVSDLADQSQLLAVNAAIEAAKAGETGRGFAVVATEVKGLAEQSKQSAGQVRGILGEIQKATQSAVMAAEQAVKTSEAGAAVAASAGAAIGGLSDSASASAQAARQVLAAAQQQMAGIEQIALAMRNIQQSSSQSVAGTRQIERAAHDLTAEARRLVALVGRGSADGAGGAP